MTQATLYSSVCLGRVSVLECANSGAFERVRSPGFSRKGVAGGCALMETGVNLAA